MNSHKLTRMLSMGIAIVSVCCFVAIAEHERSQSPGLALSKQAELALARTIAAESEGRWGEVLLWSTYGSLQHPELNEWVRYSDAAKAELISRFGVVLVVNFESRKSRRDSADQEFNDALINSLQVDLPGSIQLVDETDAVEEPVYRVSSGQVAFSVLQHIDRTEEHIHTYREQQRVANPNYYELESKLHHAEARLAHLKRGHKHRCGSCGGSGHVACKRCHGKTRIQCRHCKGSSVIIAKDSHARCKHCGGRGKRYERCNKCSGGVKIKVAKGSGRKEIGSACRRCDGKGKQKNRSCRRCKGSGKFLISRDGRKHRSERCKQCGGRGKISIPCNHCQGKGKHLVKGGRRQCKHCQGRGSTACGAFHKQGKISCGRCGGKGWYAKVSHGKLDLQRCKVKHLRHQLACEPRYLQRSVTRQQPYSVYYYRKTGRFNSSVKIWDLAYGTLVASCPIQVHYDATDSTVEIPDPDIGIDPDALELPSEREMWYELVSRAASRASGAIVDSIIRARSNQLMESARQYLDGGDRAAALESEVAAAILLESVDPASALESLTQMRQAECRM